MRVGREVRPTLALAGPIALAEVGWVTMGVADAMFVGRLGAEPLGAVGVGGTLFLAVAVFGMGMLYGLDCLVSQASGAGRADAGLSVLGQGLLLALAVSVPLTALVAESGPALRLAGVRPEIVRLTVPYSRAVAWGMTPLLVFTAFRRYLQATGRVGVFVFLLLSANVINLVADWALIFGRLGSPALGVEGAGYATVVMYAYMAAVLAGYTVCLDGRGLTRRFLRPDPATLRALSRLGLPAALQMALESGVFAVAATTAGGLDAPSLAAHHVVQTVAGLSAMTSVGLATSAAVRVGRACGRGDRAGSAAAGWTAIALASGFMSACGLAFVLAPRWILGAFTDDPAVVASGVSLLAVAAGFQVFDGVQATATGALRGLGDTRTPLFVSLTAHWLVGLPVGYALALPGHLGVRGLWIGLSTGLVLAGTALVREWARQSRLPIEPL